MSDRTRTQETPTPQVTRAAERRRRRAARRAPADVLKGAPRIHAELIGIDDTRISVTTRVGEHEWQGVCEIGDRAAFTADVYRQIAGIRDQLAAIDDTDERRRESRRLLRELGVQLLRCLFDEHTRAFLWAHRQNLTGLVVQTSDELDLPWELVHLEPPPTLADDHEPHFLASYGLIRWVQSAAHPTRLRIRRDHVRSICPTYGGPLKLSLDDEAETLRRRFGSEPARLIDAVGLRAAVRSGFDLLHFAGHGFWSSTPPPGEQLLLWDGANGTVPYTNASLAHDLHRLRASRRTRPIVVLNACDLGRVPSGPAQPAGFARTFLRWGAGAFVGCSWPVGDQPAADFAEAFYGALIDRRLTFREATIAARQCAADRGDVSEFAYSVYAHPDARVVVV